MSFPNLNLYSTTSLSHCQENTISSKKFCYHRSKYRITNNESFEYQIFKIKKISTSRCDKKNKSGVDIIKSTYNYYQLNKGYTEKIKGITGAKKGLSK